MNKLINVLRVPIIIMVFAVASTLPAQGARILAMQTIGGEILLPFLIRRLILTVKIDYFLTYLTKKKKNKFSKMKSQSTQNKNLLAYKKS